MWILVDNYDSFTHVLHHYLLELHTDIRVCRNDEIAIAELEVMQPDRIIISPGPQTPSEAGITNDVIRHFVRNTPILGVCLGHQALGVHFGATLKKAQKPVHGNTSLITHNGDRLFNGIPTQFNVMRYHSLVIEDWERMDARPLAFSGTGELMAFRHNLFPATGVQFHPESVLTEYGHELLRNWHEDCLEHNYR